MRKDLYTSFTTNPRTDHDRDFPINIYGLVPPDKRLSISVHDAWELVRSLLSTLEGHHNNRS